MECIVCGGGNFSGWCRSGAYDILKCDGCGLGVTTPFPAPQEVAALNRGAYAPEQRAALYSKRAHELDRRYSLQLRRIRRYVPAGALLDIGCNIGLFVRAAAAAGFSASGAELNEACAAYGREKFGLRISSGALEGGDFAPRSFDVVTMFDVLEHAPAPTALLASAGRLLKPGGLLVVQSPNFGSLMAALFRENWRWLTPPDHLYHFTTSALARLLTAGGFSIAEARTWEPAEDFTGNIYTGWPAESAAWRVFRKLFWLSSLALVPALQRAWWAAGLGGLAEFYSIKGEPGR